MLNTWRKLIDLFDEKERGRFRLLLSLIILMGLSNMVGVASVVPFLTVLARPSILETDPSLAWVYHISGLDDPQSFLLALGIAVFLAFSIAVGIKALTTYALIRFAEMRNFSFAFRILQGYLGHPYEWFLGRHNSDLATTILNEVQQAVRGVLLPMLHIISNTTLLIAMVLVIIFVNPLASLVMMAGVGGLYFLVFILVRGRLARLSEQRFYSNQKRFRVVQEALIGAKEVKVLGLEQRFLDRFRPPALSLAKAMAASGILAELPRHLLEGAAFGSMLAVMLVLLILEEGDLATVLPVVGVYALAGSRMLPAMQQVYAHFSQSRFSKAALDALHADMLEAQTAPALPAPPEPLQLRQRLELRSVRYTYPGTERPALDDVSLEILVNTTVGIVGGSGAGKTTAMDVMLGLLMPQEGALVVDGMARTDDRALRTWRRSLGYVPQEIFLMDESVAANIALGEEGAEIDKAAVERAARMANLHDLVVEELPAGYDTLVGDRGVRLSGGQRQRIGIARALYHDPDVLIFDEATSALDTLTERAVMEAVGRLGGAKTIVIVAHRLTTVRSCDEIFLLDNGKLAGRGSYDELIERSLLFREMARGIA